MGTMKRGLFCRVGVGEQKTEEEGVHSSSFQWLTGEQRGLTKLTKPKETLSQTVKAIVNPQK